MLRQVVSTCGRRGWTASARTLPTAATVSAPAAVNQVRCHQTLEGPQWPLPITPQEKRGPKLHADVRAAVKDYDLLTAATLLSEDYYTIVHPNLFAEVVHQLGHHQYKFELQCVHGRARRNAIYPHWHCVEHGKYYLASLATAYARCHMVGHAIQVLTVDWKDLNADTVSEDLINDLKLAREYDDETAAILLLHKHEAEAKKAMEAFEAANPDFDPTAPEFVKNASGPYPTRPQSEHTLPRELEGLWDEEFGGMGVRGKA